jgi:hypothetical protein
VKVGDRVGIKASSIDGDVYVGGKKAKSHSGLHMLAGHV